MMSLVFSLFTVIALFSISLPATQAQDTYSLDGATSSRLLMAKADPSAMLDYLRESIRGNGWSVKSMIREIVLSHLRTGVQPSKAAAKASLRTRGAPARLNEEIEKLVQQLGDQDFNVRQRASERLFEIGEPACRAQQGSVA